MNNIFSRWAVCATLFFSCRVLSGMASGSDDTFQEELTFLRRQNPQTIGRDALLQGYEDLISRYSADPRIAEAMFSVAVELESSHGDGGPRPDHEAALNWYSKSVHAAAHGTDIWIKSRFRYAARLRYVSDAANESLSKARFLLMEISNLPQLENLVSVELEDAWVGQCKRERNFEGVQEHVDKLLNWYQDPKRIPTGLEEKRIVDGYIAGAARVMVETWAVMDIPTRDRMRRIEEIKNRYSNLPGVSQTANRLLNQLEVASDVTPAGERVRPTLTTSGYWPWFIGMHLVFVAMVVAIIRMRRTRA